jgi:hypothetical protein
MPLCPAARNVGGGEVRGPQVILTPSSAEHVNTMKYLTLVATVVAALFAGPAQSQTFLQGGEWETTDQTTLEGGQPMPMASRKVCMKGNEATLERLLYPAPEEFAKHGCTFAPGSSQSGVFKATTVCPVTDDVPGVTAEADINYKPTSYEGKGHLTIREKSGKEFKGHSVLTGKRIGDC